MTTGKGGSTSQISGYRYFMAVHQGVGRGPVDELTDIQVGDLVAWTGSATFSQFIEIDQPNLFGGDEKEGGIVGTVKLFMGESTQTIDSIITDNIEGDDPVPGWRGVTTLFYYGQISSNNPYPKPWKMRVNRQTAGWDGDVWQPDLALISLKSAALTTVTFNTQPASGNSLFIGENEIDFFTTVVGDPAWNVTIGATAEDTAKNFANQLNLFSEHFSDVTASINGLTVTLQFPAATSVTAGGGAFTNISQTGSDIKAMNPAHIIYECATNNVWGRGLPRSFIDETSFLAAAQTLYAEGFGICMRWNRQEDIDKFVQIIVAHIGAAVYIDRRTGLLTLKLMREDYDADDLPAYTFENGILDITEDQSSSSDTSYNEIIVKYIDPISGRTGQVRVQNLASFQALGTLISTTVEYLGCPTAALALRLAQRDLQLNSSDVRRLIVKMDRVAWRIAPGSVFKISVPSRGIAEMILRAGNIEDGPLDDGTITIHAIQDIFGLPKSSFVTPQPSFWTPPNRTPEVITERLIDELTYYDLSFNLPPAELAAITADTGLLKVFAEQPSGSNIDYVVYDHTSGEVDFAERATAGYDAGAELIGTLDYYDTVATFGSGNALSRVETLGIPVLLVDQDDSTKQEYCELVAFDDIGTMTIARGCIDTIPHRFTTGAKVWFQTNMPTTDFRDYSTGETLSVKLLSRTSSAQLDPVLADTDELDIAGRQGRPYPPGNVEIGGDPAFSVSIVDGDVIFTWAHRDRIIEANTLVDHTAGSTGPEVGTTYTTRVYDGADPEPTSLLRTVTGISGTTWTYDTTMAIADGDLFSYWFELESVRDGLPSWQNYQFFVQRSPGFNDGFDDNFDGGPP